MSTIYQVASWANDVFGYRAMTALPLVFFALLVVRQFRLFRLNLPILRWFWGVNESQIYQGLGYHYNGGMHMANILYWNFGLIGVALGGFAFGRITRRCDVLLRHLPTAGGTLAGMLAAGWALLLPITIWYSPVAIINVTIAIVVIYAVIRFANGPFLLMPRRTRRA